MPDTLWASSLWTTGRMPRHRARCTRRAGPRTFLPRGSVVRNRHRRRAPKPQQMMPHFRKCGIIRSPSPPRPGCLRVQWWNGHLATCRGIRYSCTARSPTHPTRPETRERAAPARIAELNNCAILSILTRQFPAPLSWRPALGLRAGATDQRQALQVVQLAQSAGCTGGGRVSQDSQKRCHTS